MIDLEQGRPEVSRGDLIVFEDGTDQPPSFLVKIEPKVWLSATRAQWSMMFTMLAVVVLGSSPDPGNLLELECAIHAYALEFGAAKVCLR